MDCSEIFIDRPKNLTARVQTWLNYKHNNTSKYLVWVLATVLISFISCGRSGLISDKQKALQPGFLKRFTFGDLILADRGFKLHDEIASADTRFHERKVTVIAMCSGYFKRERVIGRLKKFQYLQNTFPIQQVDLLDNVMIRISGCFNLSQKKVS